MHPPRPPGRRTARPTTLLITIGALLVVAGAVAIVTGRSFGLGWYDDAPGTAGGPTVPLAALDHLVVTTPRLFWGERVLALGLVVVAAAVGFLLGRRR